MAPGFAASEAVLARGGLVFPSDFISHFVDYLVVGTLGSDRWNWADYGAKIEGAVVERSVHGRPAILAESQLVQLIMSGARTNAAFRI